MKKIFLQVAKIAVSAVIIFILLKKIPLSEIAAALSSANIFIVIIGLITGPVILLISAVNTKVLLDAQGVRMKLSKIFEINYSAEFYNFLVPGFLTGGLIRWHQFSRSSGKPAASLATVAFVRLWDTIILLGVGLLLWLMDPIARQRPVIGLALGVAVSCIFIATMLCFNKNTTMFIEKKVIRLHRIPARTRAKIGSVLTSLRVFDTHRRHVLSATIGLTILRNMCGITAYYLFALSLGITISAVSLGWIRSVVHTILLFPISFSGIGIREGGMVVFLKDYGVIPAQAVALSFLLLLNTLGVRCIGAVVATIKFFKQHSWLTIR
jgi:glycosyltransferase 2 family protein